MESSNIRKGSEGDKSQEPKPLLFNPDGNGMNMEVVPEEIAGLKGYIDTVLVPATKAKIEKVADDEHMNSKEKEAAVASYKAGLAAVGATLEED